MDSYFLGLGAFALALLMFTQTDFWLFGIACIFLSLYGLYTSKWIS